tara:strand:- start:5 stop:679 length:675 start_codon:yes stop_codon:yes gene_type:complete
MITYISLGQNCKPVENAIKNRNMKTKREGRKTCVFDLMITSYTALLELIESNFDNFFDNIKLIKNPKNIKFKTNDNSLIYSTNANKPYGKIITNDKLGIIFNHESPGHPSLHHMEKWDNKNMYVENNFSKFKIRYSNRINAFQNYIKNSDEVIFLIYTIYFPRKLDAIIKKTYPKLKYKIHVYNTSESMINTISYIDLHFKTNVDECKLTDFNKGYIEGNIHYL